MRHEKHLLNHRLLCVYPDLEERNKACPCQRLIQNGALLRQAKRFCFLLLIWSGMIKKEKLF
ncbi:hypothetical protein B1A98_00775 [Bacillus badius]|nr:hypothetical protein B1A98_00775 [Bacillus badius]